MKSPPGVSTRHESKKATLGPFAMLLQVPEQGYHLETDAEGHQWLVAPVQIGEGFRARQYPPFANINLHRRFARVGFTPVRIRLFANQFGALGQGEVLPESFRVGEKLSFWQSEIAEMATLLALWDLVIQRDRNELSRYLLWRQNPTTVMLRLVSAGGRLIPVGVKRVEDKGLERTLNDIRDEHEAPVQFPHDTIAMQGLNDNSDFLLRRWTFGDPIEPARYYVHREINERLKGHVNPAVLPFSQGDIYFFPDCLLSALYTLFAHEVSGRTRPAIACRHCGAYFIPVHGSQKYHDERCRKLAYYHKPKSNDSSVC